MDTLKTLPAIEQHLAAHGLSLLYIVSRDCGVCHAVEPKLESVLVDWPQIAAVRADVAELPALAGRFHALAAPVVILFGQGSVHNSSRGNILAQKRACCVENARKVFNLAVLFALQPRFCAQNLTRG